MSLDDDVLSWIVRIFYRIVSSHRKPSSRRTVSGIEMREFMLMLIVVLAIYGGSPAALVEDFPETAKELMIDVTQSFYQNFKPTV